MKRNSLYKTGIVLLAFAWVYPKAQGQNLPAVPQSAVKARVIAPQNNNFWQQSGPSEKVVRALAINSNGHIFAGTSDDGVFRSTDGGGSWTQINNGLLDIHVYSLVINSSGHIFAGTSGNGIIRSVYRSTDNGENWSQVNFGMENTNPIYSLAVNSNGDIFSGTNGDGVFRSQDNGASWTKINSGLTDLSVMSLAINSSGDIFAGTAIDGIFRSTNNGDNWTPVNNGLTHTNVWSLAVNSSGHIFAGSFSYGGGVFRSTDNGGSWTQVNTGLTELRVLSLAVNSSGHIFAGTVDGVFRSIDNGSSWTPVNSGLTETFVYALAPNASDQIFAGTNGNGVFRSAESTTSCYTLTTVVNPNGSGTITTSLPNCSGNYFFGTSIDLTATPNSGYIFNSWLGSAGTLVNASSSTTTFTITGNAVVTANFKKPAPTWVTRYNGPANAVDEANALAVDNAGNVYVTGHSQGASGNRDYVTLKYNTAGARQWSARYNSPANNLDEAKDIAVDAAGNVYVAGFSYGADGNLDYFTIKYNNTGKWQWSARYNGPGNGDDKINALSIDGVGNIFVTGQSLGKNGNPDYATIKYNSAGVQQWAARYNAPINNDDEAQKIIVDGSGDIYVTGKSYGANGNFDYCTIKYSSAGVQQWVARYNGPGNGDDIANNLTIDGVGNVYVTGHSFGLKGSQDYATIKYNSLGEWQWVARYNGPANSTDEARGLAVDAFGNVYVSGYSSAVLWNHDCFTIKYNIAGVQQWTARYNGPGNGQDFGNALAIDAAGNIYVTGHSLGSSGSQDFITIKYNNTGVRQWIARYNAPANKLDEARDIAVDPSGNVYVAGYSLAANGKADYITIKYSSSSANAQIVEGEGDILEENEESESDEDRLAIDRKTTVPTSFVLSQNFPNPFNPTTTIRFATPSAGKVKLTVYNIYGELVRTLMDGEVAAGDHEVSFDASNLATGIYFYRLEAGAFTATQKMILAK